MPLVPTDRFVLVAIPEDRAFTVCVAVVQGVAVAAGILWVIGFDDLPSDYPVSDTGFNVFDHRMTHRHTMVQIPLQ